MKLLVGLGNPGDKYAGHRHNIGFMLLDRIAEQNGFPHWKSRFQGSVSEHRMGGDKVLLLKPETYMNESGRSVGEAVKFYKLEPEDVIVFHDELDLAPGKLRVKTGGGVAGHNGLRSISASVLGNDYIRVRLGIGHPGHKDRVAGYVLRDFAKVDRDWLEQLLDAAARAAPRLVEDDAQRFMTDVAQALQPAKPKEKKTVENSRQNNEPATNTQKGEPQKSSGPLADKLKAWLKPGSD